MTNSMGWPFPKRKAFLDELLAARSDRTHELTFQRRRQTLSKYSVPLDLPKYRLSNGRTLASQAEFLARHQELPPDYFSRDLESEDAQRIQHDLLKKMLDGAGLLKYFREHEQQEPIILSSQGFVVNGNRRVCAMRELVSEDSTKYERFKTIDIAILPPATDQDIFELEAELQIQPDIKDEYSWYTTAMMIRKQRTEYKRSWEELAHLYQIREADVKERLYRLEDAELYLEDRGKQGIYNLLEGTEYAFRQLRVNRDSNKLFKSDEEKTVYEGLCYCLIDENNDQGRLYEAIPSVAKYFARVVEDVRAELDLTAVEDLSDVLQASAEESNRPTIREVISNVVASEKLKERERKQKNFVSDQVRRANTALTEAVAAITKDTPTTGISDQLVGIEAQILKLRAWLQKNGAN